MLITNPELKEMQREAVVGVLQDYIAGSGQKVLEETRKQLSSKESKLAGDASRTFY
jgi:uncharacterized protein HemY